jgi:predicted ArsR family transcriptional regulator
MNGLTITEMAKKLGITYLTAKQRLLRLGIKPVTKEALYDESALEAIRNVPGKGRPPKTKPEEPAKTAPKPKK